jgi:phosphoribosyl 1,2-cyclic phosphodiesterase
VTGEGAFLVRFWGVRGSIAAPGPHTVRYGGNTPCIELRCGPHFVIVDAGTGLRLMGQQTCLTAPVHADILLTHTHYDHILGLPFFGPAYDPANSFVLWEGHLGPDRQLHDVMSQLMSEPLFPVPIQLIDTACRYRKFTAGDSFELQPGLIVRTAAVSHPNNCTGYRVEWGGRSACIVTDTEHVPGTLDAGILELARDADIFVYDATYSDAELPKHIGWGHSTWEQGCRLAEAAGAKRLHLFHHDPSRSDTELDAIGIAARRMFPAAVVAAEGDTVLL